MTDTKVITEFWDKQSCGEVYATGESARDQLNRQAAIRYQLEPYIFDFAKFPEAKGKEVLEIGVGMGADHLEWAKAQPRRLVGVDASERALAFTRERLQLEGLFPDVRLASAEDLPFPSNSFDMVYSWGVLHHTSNPAKSINEVFRVLRPEGVARVMIYHKWSITGLLLWLRYGYLTRSMTSVYAAHLESPGTQAYSVRRARRLFSNFSLVTITRKLSVSDLLEGAAGQRHQGLGLARKVWPRWLLKRFPTFGLFLLIEAYKPPYKEKPFSLSVAFKRLLRELRQL